MVACADMITAHAETNGCMCRHDHCIRRSLHVHAISVYSHQDTPMYMQTLLLKHTARHSLVPRPYFFLLLSLFIHKRHSEAAKKEMGVQLRKVRPGLGNRVIHKDFYERGRYVAHNHDVRYSPTHSELIKLY